MSRILGHLRIFQAVQADLKMDNNWASNSYQYNGADPFNLEDDAFPITVGLINQYVAEKQIEVVDELLTTLTRTDSREVLEKLRIELEKGLPK